MKNVLIITYYWPPSGGGGVQRVLKFCKYLVGYGWNPIVLTVENGEFPDLDNSLVEDAKGIACTKAKSFSLYSIFKKFSGKKNVPSHQISPGNNDNLIIKLSRWIRFNLIIPDGRVGWYFGAFRAAKKIINNNDIDMIFTSGPPHSVHLIGNSIAKKTGIKWVTDFRDPWVDNFYYIENPRNKIISFFDNYLEKLVLRNCNYLITVSNGVLSLLNQNKHLNGKSEVIYNGYDPADFNNKKCKKLLNRKNIIISHIGTLSKSQNPKGLFNSVKKYNLLNDKKPILIKCIGSVHSSIENYAMKNGFKQFLSIMPYVEHSLAIDEMINSDILFVVIPDLQKNRGIITGKLFEYIASGTEIILIGSNESEASNILMDLGYQHVYGINDEIDFNSFKINNYKRQFSLSKISRIEQSKQLSQIFDKLLDKNHTK